MSRSRRLRRPAGSGSPTSSGDQEVGTCSASPATDLRELAALLSRCARSLAWLTRSSARPEPSELEELASAYLELAGLHPWLLALLPWVRGLASLSPLLDRFPRSAQACAASGGASVRDRGDPEAAGL
jgi:hypothetical protein